VKGRLLLDIVVRQGSTVFKLFASKDESLLIRRNAFLVLDLGLDVFDGVRWLNFQSDGFTRKGFHEDLHGRLFKRRI